MSKNIAMIFPPNMNKAKTERKVVTTVNMVRDNVSLMLLFKISTNVISRHLLIFSRILSKTTIVSLIE